MIREDDIPMNTLCHNLLKEVQLLQKRICSSRRKFCLKRVGLSTRLLFGRVLWSRERRKHSQNVVSLVLCNKPAPWEKAPPGMVAEVKLRLHQLVYTDN